MDTLERLQAWYMSCCNGDWEHESGFTMEVLDNPGWLIKQRLDTLELELVDSNLDEERSEQDWIYVGVQDGVLKVACGPLNLTEALTRFLNLVERPGRVRVESEASRAW